eukprot:snap_masked-scaffold_18-processed-gene-2.30-mRNA-1 protein AED:1.00 eAED:1.00 QI:0/0/0/0/1/1/2/0/63
MIYFVSQLQLRFKTISDTICRVKQTWEREKIMLCDNKIWCHQQYGSVFTMYKNNAKKRILFKA